MLKPLIFLDSTKVHQMASLPEGPHAIIWFPASLSFSFHEASLEDTQRPNIQAYASLGSTYTKINDQQRPDYFSFTEAVPYLCITGSLGSCMFDTRPFLEHCTLYCVGAGANAPAIGSESSIASPIGGMLESNELQKGIQQTESFHKNSQHYYTSPCISIRLRGNTAQAFQIFQRLCTLLPIVLEDCTQGHAIRCFLTGVGNKVQCSDHSLTFTTGVSHPIGVQLPSTVWVRAETSTQFTLFGLQREEVCQWASVLRHQIFRKNAYAPPVLHYEGEVYTIKKTRKK